MLRRLLRQIFGPPDLEESGYPEETDVYLIRQRERLEQERHQKRLRENAKKMAFIPPEETET